MNEEHKLTTVQQLKTLYNALYNKIATRLKFFLLYLHVQMIGCKLIRVTL